MNDVLILNQRQVRQLLDPAALLTALENALRELSAGRASVPPRVAATTGNGLVAAMPGCVPGLGLAVKLVSVFAGGGPRVAVPSGRHRPVRRRERPAARAHGRHLHHGRPHGDHGRSRRPHPRPPRTRACSPCSAPAFRALPTWTRSGEP